MAKIAAILVVVFVLNRVVRGLFTGEIVAGRRGISFLGATNSRGFTGL